MGRGVEHGSRSIAGRSRWLALFAACAAVAVTTVAAPPPASADIVTPGSRFLKQHRYVLELGRFDDYCEHRHLVVEGDTLEAIARAAYGDPARVADLRRANPGIEPTALQLKSQLLLPPKRPVPADAQEPLAWQLWRTRGASRLVDLERWYPGEEEPVHNLGTSFVAVPVAHAADFEQLRHDRPGACFDGTWESAYPWLVSSGGVHFERSVAITSAVVSMRTTLTLEAIEPPPAAGPRHRFVVRSEKFDAAGKPLAAGSLRSGREWLLLPALLGAIVVALRVRQARRERRAIVSAA